LYIKFTTHTKHTKKTKITNGTKKTKNTNAAKGRSPLVTGMRKSCRPSVMEKVAGG